MFTAVNSVKARVIAAVVIAVFVVAELGQRSCDRAGNWPHREETRVFEGAVDWPKGEERKCSALPREDGTIFFLGCVEGSVEGTQDFTRAEPVEVTYWGRTKREDRFQALHSERMEGWHWRCTNSGGSLTCYAVN